jgi:pimeloyl-ACP methyl ester carboxylesterase
MMCDARIFAAQLSRFPGSVAVNGFGLLRSITDMARRALRTVSGQLSLVGHSMGARVAVEAFRLAPERIDRIALLSTGIHPVRPGEAEARHRMCEVGRAQGVDALVEQWLPPMVAPTRRNDSTLMAPLRAMCREVGAEAFAAQIEALLHRPAVEPVLPQITCPAMVAVGGEDRWSPPAQHQAIAAALPNARLHVMEGAGHMLPAEAPDLLNATIADWLSWPTHAQGVS